MKKVKVLAASVLFCAMGHIGYTAYEKMTVSEAEKFMEVNVEALTRGESGAGGTNYNICYSESVVRIGASYYDCGNCLKKIYDEKGKGSYTKCFY